MTSKIDRSGLNLSGQVAIGAMANPTYDLHVLRADGASGTLSLSGATATGGPSYIIMGNNDSAGVGGPNVIVSANRSLQFGVGNSFTAAGGGSFTSQLSISPTGVVSIVNGVAIGVDSVKNQHVIRGGANGQANMLTIVDGRAGAFSNITIDVNLGGPGGWSYWVSSGGTGQGQFQAGGGYTNSTANYSHTTRVGSGWSVSSPSNDVIRFVGGSPGTHPNVMMQICGSLSQLLDSSRYTVTFS
jgi:hypothetical protein